MKILLVSFKLKNYSTQNKTFIKQRKQDFKSFLEIVNKKQETGYEYDVILFPGWTLNKKDIIELIKNQDNLIKNDKSLIIFEGYTPIDSQNENIDIIEKVESEDEDYNPDEIIKKEDKKRFICFIKEGKIDISLDKIDIIEEWRNQYFSKASEATSELIKSFFENALNKRIHTLNNQKILSLLCGELFLMKVNGIRLLKKYEKGDKNKYEQILKQNINIVMNIIHIPMKYTNLNHKMSNNINKTQLGWSNICHYYISTCNRINEKDNQIIFDCINNGNQINKEITQNQEYWLASIII